MDKVELSSGNCRDGRILQWHAAANHPTLFYFPQLNEHNLSICNVRRLLRPAWLSAPVLFCRAEGLALSEIARRLAVGRRIVRKWLKRVFNQRKAGLADKFGWGRQPMFSVEVAVHLVKMACERPGLRGRSLSQ
jgi:hypothetical protein